MKTIIYSKDNPQSVERVRIERKKHPRFIFLELGDTEAVTKAINNDSDSIFMLDKPKKIEAPKVKKSTPPKVKKPTAPKVKKPAAKKRGRPAKKK